MAKLKKKLGKPQEGIPPVEEIDSESASPFAALIDISEASTADTNDNVKDVFVIPEATPSVPDSLALIQPGTMEIRVRDSESGQFNTCYRWQGPAIEAYIPIWGDWTGSGAAALGLYHPASGYFNLFSGLDCGHLLFRLSLGNTGKEWQPLAGDWDGDGKDGVGLYNIETGKFLVCNKLGNGHADVEIRFKNEHHRSGDLAISGDWNGDGLDEVAVYNPNHGEFTLFDSLSPGCKFSIHPAHNAGPDWTPVTGDWRGIGFDSIGLYDNEAGIFYLLNAADDQDPEIIIPVNKETGYWRPLSLKGFSSLKEADEQQTLPAEVGDAKGESAWVGKINGLIKVKKYREALNQADQALKANPMSSQLSQVRGKAASKLKLYDLAEISIQNALSKNPDDIEAIIELGGLAEVQEKWDKALLYWDLSLPKIKERKHMFDVLSAKAHTLIELKSYDQADKIYQGMKTVFSF
ncbi:MAG: tetratricopeptide repeat protein, partial [Methylococcus sp.]